MIGKTLSHYQILEKLGGGTGGEVYLAEDIPHSRRVALKLLPEYLHDDEIATKRFLREGKATVAIDSPYVCKTYGFGQSDGRTYLAMEFVQGETLEKRLAREQIPYREALQIGIQIAEALSRAHKCGVVHRDLKPSNIMLDENGRVKVMDFGLAKRLETETQPDVTVGLTKEGVILGTWTYMSPEQLKGESVHGRTDIFSFGLLLWELFTGEHPFRQESSVQTVSAILRDDPPAVEEGVLAGEPELYKIILRMLEKSPESRLELADEVGDRLRDLAKKSAPMRHPIWRWTGFAALLILSILVILVAVAIIG
jgi:serine/threonine-protein kinase